MSPKYHSSLARRVRGLMAVLGGLNLVSLLLLVMLSDPFFASRARLPFGLTGFPPQVTILSLIVGGVVVILFWFALPWVLFRWVLTARCPACGEKMRLEIPSPPRYYCRHCGNIADDGTMQILAHTPVPPPKSLTDGVDG
ncbi:MAG: zinc ribbon domain-containing protein [Planctomycetota bacterium]|nr:zinc ribbon domain-containing protein [Planctomycetota bacterium]